MAEVCMRVIDNMGFFTSCRESPVARASDWRFESHMFDTCSPLKPISIVQMDEHVTIALLSNGFLIRHCEHMQIRYITGIL